MGLLDAPRAEMRYTTHSHTLTLTHTHSHSHSHTHTSTHLIESWRDVSNCSMSLMRKLKGIPMRDSFPNGSSECFSDMANPLDDMPACVYVNTLSMLQYVLA